jgi:hypothetical protein
VLIDYSFLNYNDLVSKINSLVITDSKWLEMIYYILNYKYFKNNYNTIFFDGILDIYDDRYRNSYNYDQHINVKIIEELFKSFGKNIIKKRYFR